MRVSSQARFWAKVDKNGPIQPHMKTRCWPWTGHITRFGYGTFSVSKVSISAHRFAWTVQRGPIPDGLHVLHHCDYRRCQRGGHLFVGTAGDNMADRDAKGRGARGIRVGTAKLNDALVRQIRREYIPRVVTQQELADRFGVAQSIVWKALYGTYWAHVAGSRAGLTRRPPRSPR